MILEQPLHIYNSLSRQKEKFVPITPGFVGMYVCGPTVYGYPHLGHARPYITFDVLYRYLQHLGYKVRFVKNITDVGHLEDELAGEGEDKISKKARLEQLEPMEVAQYYTDAFHEKLTALNIKNPSIEPRASGHIMEQVKMIEDIIRNGFAYEVNGSVYFDVVKYNKTSNYGKLSGRVLEDLISGAGEERRELEGQTEKRNRADFALWKKASDEHIMKWDSPWGIGFPGWHIECSAMSSKYLGETFDIHGGGMDLLFPHHECEIAQSNAANHKDPVKYWMHNNMITINGQKMGKSLGNFITLEELFTGKNVLLEQAYSPMTVRFFILQAHYRSTLDFSNEGLKAAEKGMQKLFNAIELVHKLTPSVSSTSDVQALKQKCYDSLNDDLNTAILISHLFEGVRITNSVYAGTETISAADLETLKNIFNLFTFDILGLKAEGGNESNDLDGLMKLILNMRSEAKSKKDFATSDKIRDELLKVGFEIKDGKEGTLWSKK
jgi:cysteinyl-tRNA synthetase